jgi:predicted CoA-binding protein
LRWPTNTTPITFIKNEELILLKAEAHANLNQATEAVEAINIIRNAAEIGNYTGATTQEALIDEILFQRRYSLWAEPWGHRWIDARRYDRLDEIPTSYDQGTIFRQFPHPQAEVSWDQYVSD